MTNKKPLQIECFMVLNSPLHQNLIYWLSPTAALEQSPRAIWDAASWDTVLFLPQIKLNSQLSSCTFFFSRQVQYCKEQYCIETWNVRSMNQGKLDVVKQEMARLNTDILGIGELKWMRMGEFNSDDHYIYYCGQESCKRNGVALIVNKRIWNAVLGCNLTNHWMIVPFQGKPFTSLLWNEMFTALLSTS